MSANMMTQAEFSLRTKEANKYLNAIRNAEKRRYAYEYWGFRRGLMNEPNPDHFNLGAMARQAVRMQMNEIMGW